MDKLVSGKLEEFFKSGKQQVYKKGEIMIRADDNPAGVFYLTKGIVKEYAISKKGEELVVNVYKPVSFFPMSWAINQTPNNYYYEALDEVAVRRVPANEVISFIKDNPDVLYDLVRRLYIGVDGILMRMVYLMSGEAYERVIAELLISAKRYGIVAADEKAVSLDLSEKDLADRTGMARETVSREIKILKDKGLVAFVKNALIITDIVALEHELFTE